MGAFEDKWSDFEQTVGPLLVSELSQEAPVGDPETDPDSGTLSQSMMWEDQMGVLTVGSDDVRGPIAAYVTRGTSPHDIYPLYADSLHFFASDGMEVFTRHVSHPGTVANQFHIRAWEQRREQVHRLFRDTVGGGVALAYLNPWRSRTL